MKLKCYGCYHTVVGKITGTNLRRNQAKRNGFLVAKNNTTSHSGWKNCQGIMVQHTEEVTLNPVTPKAK